MALKIENGQKFWKLTAIKEVPKKSKNNSRRFLWECDCGKTLECDISTVKRGNTKSCGCYKLNSLATRCITHGKSKTRIHRIWRAIKNRCNENSTAINPHYAGRGISICEEWVNNFEEFYKWSMDNEYADNLSIDRIRVNGNYGPDNCRWATRADQARNTRANHFIQFGGEKMCLQDWATRVGVTAGSLHRRIKLWGLEKALTTPGNSKYNKNPF